MVQQVIMVNKVSVKHFGSHNKNFTGLNAILKGRFCRKRIKPLQQQSRQGHPNTRHPTCRQFPINLVQYSPPTGVRRALRKVAVTHQTNSVFPADCGYGSFTQWGAPILFILHLRQDRPSTSSRWITRQFAKVKKPTPPKCGSINANFLPGRGQAPFSCHKLYIEKEPEGLTPGPLK